MTGSPENREPLWSESIKTDGAGILHVFVPGPEATSNWIRHISQALAKLTWLSQLQCDRPCGYTKAGDQCAHVTNGLLVTDPYPYPVDLLIDVHPEPPSVSYQGPK